MENGYDENLNENIFFKVLQTIYDKVFHKAVNENWIICVPCTQSLDNYDINEWNIFTHLLVPSEELPETHFSTLNNEDVTICEKLVKLRSYCDVPILFTEIFYVNQTRYEVLCLERPLNFNNDEERLHPRIYFVKTLEECLDILTTESTNGLAVKKLDEIINQFLFLSSKDYFHKSIDQQIILMKNIYNRCVKIVLQDKNIIIKAKSSPMFKENIHIAVESYMLHNIYSIVMKGLISNMTEEIGSFNRALRNLASIQLQDLTIENAILESIPRARNEISRFNNYTTVLGKLSCLKRCINLISNTQSKKLSIDELLPVLVFLVVKSGITTWIAQLKYITEFNFSHSDQNQANESCFLTTTLEAVITFIKSGMFFKSMNVGGNQLKLMKLDKKSTNLSTYICHKNKLFWQTSNPKLINIFQSIYEGNLNELENIFKQQKEEVKSEISKNEPKEITSITKSQFCHPLCSCDRCEKLHLHCNQEKIPLTINSSNECGCSLLHVAACYGHSAIVDWLLNCGANANCIDFAGSTPLHCAAMHGYQNIILLLIYANGKLDQYDDDGNQPLHLACINGHVDCVKALLYFAEHAGIQLNVNSTNKDGDTPLHLAVKYYYKDIIEILLNYNANSTIKNKHGYTVFELTNSLTIRDILNQQYISVVNLMDILTSSPLSTTFSEEKIEKENNFQPSDKLFLYKDKKLLHLQKDELGVQPTTAKSLKNAEQLFEAIYKNDLKIMRHVLGFDSNAYNNKSNIENSMKEQETQLSYKCHPLCQCKNCRGNTQLYDEDEEYVNGDFRKIDTISVNICNTEGFTALHIASKCGNIAAMQFLLDIGAKINVRTYQQLLTPLHVACIANQLQAVKFLLDYGGCKINLCDQYNNTALHYACIAGNTRLVELLMKYSPDIGIKNEGGKTAVNECEENLSYLIMRMLKSPKTIATEELLS